MLTQVVHREECEAASMSHLHGTEILETMHLEISEFQRYRLKLSQAWYLFVTGKLNPLETHFSHAVIKVALLIFLLSQNCPNQQIPSGPS